MSSRRELKLKNRETDRERSERSERESRWDLMSTSVGEFLQGFQIIVVDVDRLVMFQTNGDRAFGVSDQTDIEANAFVRLVVHGLFDAS